MATEISNLQITKSKFGVPTTSGGSGSGILMPKLRYRFRVSLLDGFGGATRTIELTQNVMSVSRPKISYEEVPIDSYNSKVYIQGKHSWETISLTMRDDITNGVVKLVGAQVQRQLNHYQQTTPAAGNDYKFNMQIEVLDGSNNGSSEVWFLEGCFITQADYSETDYSSNEPVTVALTIRFDNATNYQGTNDIDGRVQGGDPMPDASLFGTDGPQA